MWHVWIVVHCPLTLTDTHTHTQFVRVCASHERVGAQPGERAKWSKQANTMAAGMGGCIARPTNCVQYTRKGHKHVFSSTGGRGSRPFTFIHSSGCDIHPVIYSLRFLFISSRCSINFDSKIQILKIFFFLIILIKTFSLWIYSIIRPQCPQCCVR